MLKYTVEVNNLVRKFGNLSAVNGISLQVSPGEVFGLLGPNGAGKTTTIKLLCTLLRPTSGTATVAGYDVIRQPDAVRQSIGIVFQDPSLDDRLTAMENLWFHAMLFDVRMDQFKTRAREVLELVELADRADSDVRTFSGGMKRRLEIARGLLHSPRVLFLDEPTLGLDPQTRRHIWDYVLALREQEGITVFLTTHYMDEVEHANRVVIIDRGRVVAMDTPDNLKAMVGGDVITLQTSDDKLAAYIIQQKFHLEARSNGDELTFEVPQGDKFIPQLMAALNNGNGEVKVLRISLRRPSFDDVFIKLTGRAIREEEGDGKDMFRLHSNRMFGSRPR